MREKHACKTKRPLHNTCCRAEWTHVVLCRNDVRCVRCDDLFHVWLVCSSCSVKSERCWWHDRWNISYSNDRPLHAEMFCCWTLTLAGIQMSITIELLKAERSPEAWINESRHRTRASRCIKPYDHAQLWSLTISAGFTIVCRRTKTTINKKCAVLLCTFIQECYSYF